MLMLWLDKHQPTGDNFKDKVDDDENGKRTGEWKTYHDNGKLESIGNSKDGEQIGVWKYFDENEKIINTTEH